MLFAPFGPTSAVVNAVTCRIPGGGGTDMDGESGPPRESSRARHCSMMPSRNMGTTSIRRFSLMPFRLSLLTVASTYVRQKSVSDAADWRAARKSWSTARRLALEPKSSMRTKSRSFCLSSESMAGGARTQMLSASDSGSSTFTTTAGNKDECLCLKSSSSDSATSLPLPFDEAGLIGQAFCEALEGAAVSVTALLLLEQLPSATSSALRFEGEDCTGLDLVPVLLLVERRRSITSLSSVLDEEALVGDVVVVVVDFDLAMASATKGRAGAGRSGVE